MMHSIRAVIMFAKNSFLLSPPPQRGERVRVRGGRKTFWQRVYPAG
jgi:hypothetical protein